jgi:hypothetical protein
MHPSHRQLHITPIEAPLYVVMVIDNPEMFASRYKHYHTVAKHVEDSGAILYTVEVAIGDRHFEVTEAGNPRHIQLRGKTSLWRKENLQNIGVAHLPHDWKYVALCDADIINTRPDWVQATIQALQRYDAVQLFSTYSCLKSDHTVESTNNGFVYVWQLPGTAPDSNDYNAIHGAPGGEWAYSRHAWDTLEGMLQTPILGSADWYMAYALAGLRDSVKDEELQRCAPEYIRSINEWGERAKSLNANIWYVQNHALHYWHGSIASRGYGWRPKILATHTFNPYQDVKQEHTGLLELRPNKPGMRNEINAYFRSRNEDSI